MEVWSGPAGRVKARAFARPDYIDAADAGVHA